MKLFNFVAGAVIALALFAGGMAVVTPNVKAAAVVDNDPDCDKYAVIYCGAFKQSGLEYKYLNGDTKNSAANIQQIFTSFGISKAEVLAGGYVDGIVYQNGEVRVGNKVVATGAQTYIRTMGKVSASRMGSAQTAFVKLNKNGQFEYAIMKPCGNPVSAKNVVPPPKPPTPIYDCTSLTSRLISTRTYGYTLSYTAKNGATLTSVNYNFGDGKTQNGVKPADVNKVQHTFAKAGTFTTTATLNFNVNGKAATKTCNVKITINETPVYNCIALQARVINASTRTFGYTLKYTAANGATLTSVNYNFGDGKTQNGVKPADVNKVQHTFAKAGTYTTTATLNFNVNGKVASTNCSVVIHAQPNVCPINPSVPVDSPKCKPCPTNPNLPVDSPECVTTPSELPNTGAGSTMALFAGTVLASAAAYRLWIIRKLS